MVQFGLTISKKRKIPIRVIVSRERCLSVLFISNCMRIGFGGSEGKEEEICMY